MSQTLGEKLRQAREERGISLTEVAEQTRISPQYIESIERDDYKPLPGGIFNKGFVKSFAKYVGVDENEALADYLRIVAEKEGQDDEDLKTYKPEVLTDDYSSRSRIPTILGAVVILGLMTAGILYFLNYRNGSSELTPVSNTNTNATAQNTNTATPVTNISSIPEMASLKVEFKALSEPVSLSANSDGKLSSNVVPAGSTNLFEPKESLKLGYSKSLANFVQLTINGKVIKTPGQPLVPRRNAIEFEITKGNLAQIWESGAITTDVPSANIDPDANIGTANTATPTATTQPVPRPVSTVKQPIAVNSAPVTRTNPTPKPTVMIVPSANRPG